MKAPGGFIYYVKALVTRDIQAAQEFAVSRPVVAATVLAGFVDLLTAGFVVALGIRELVIVLLLCGFCFVDYFAFFFYLAHRTRGEMADEARRIAGGRAVELNEEEIDLLWKRQERSWSTEED
jgi:hypothetical protein